MASSLLSIISRVAVCLPPHNKQDNFIHADLHPGNILVRLEEAPVPLPGGLLGALRSLLPFELKLPRLVSLWQNCWVGA